jgi:L-cysteine desulfidase
LKEKATLLKQHLKEATAELDIVSTKYKEEQVKRKKLLNELEDMKGKVRVYCRIRPFSNSEKTNADQVQPCVSIKDETQMTVGTQKNRMKEYNFDAVFGPESTQEEVFDDTKRLI